MPKTYTAIQSIPMLVRYHENGIIEYSNPNTGEVYFSRQSPGGKSPIVEFRQKEDVMGMFKRKKPAQVAQIAVAWDDDKARKAHHYQLFLIDKRNTLKIPLPHGRGDIQITIDLQNKHACAMFKK